MLRLMIIYSAKKATIYNNKCLSSTIQRHL